LTLSDSEVQDLTLAGRVLRQGDDCRSARNVQDDLHIDLTFGGVSVRCGEAGLPGSCAERLVTLIRRLVWTHGQAAGSSLR